MICCQNLRGNESVPSPFSRIIALDWYDGAKSGLAQCQGCARVYSFDLGAWDDEQDSRIYVLSELPASALDDAVNILAPLGKPQWPLWVPSWRFQSTDDERYVDSEVSNLLAATAPPMLLLASDDLARRITTARRVTTPEQWERLHALRAEATSVDDWRAFLDEDEGNR